jgi:hypothetical protein
MAKFIDGYIDIRLHVTLEEETFSVLDGEEYSQNFMVDASPEVIGYSGIEGHELQGIAESLSQMDRHQMMLANDIPNEIYNHEVEDSEE